MSRCDASRRLASCLIGLSAYALTLALVAGCLAAPARSASPAPSANKPTVAKPATAAPTTQPSAVTEPTRYYGFGPMEVLKMEWGLGKPVVADINRDGLNDLVVVNNHKSRIDLLLQKKHFDFDQAALAPPSSDDINDIFGREKLWRFKRVSVPLDVAATSLVVADLNHDGWPDLAYYSQEGLYVLLQEPPARNSAVGATAASGPREPRWRPARKFDITDGLSTEGALAAGDLNGDGRTDLALLANDGAYILLQKADGQLAAPVRFYSSAQRLRQINIADIDGDGRPDLIMLCGDQDYPIRVRFQDSEGQLGPDVRLALPPPVAMQVVKLSKTGRAIFASISAKSGRVILSALQRSKDTSAQAVFSYPLPVTQSPGDRDIVAADLNGDGVKEVVVTDPSRAEFLLLPASKRLRLGTPEVFPGLMDMRKLCAGDLDGSGRSDLVALSRKEKVIGLSRLENGRLTFPSALPITGEPVAMALADVNGNGRLDLVYVSKSKANGKTSYFLRTLLDLGQTNPKPGPILELKSLQDDPMDIRAADFDHDGRVDVLVLRQFGGPMLLLQSKPGVFSVAPDTESGSGLLANVDPSALSLAPVGPAGSPAVLVAQKNFTRSLTYDAKKGWRVIDQYQAQDRQSNVAAATTFREGPGQALKLATYDSAQGKLDILARQADGTYRTERQVDVGALSVKKILAGNLGGGAPESLLICGAHRLALVPLPGRAERLRQVASFDPDIEKGHYGALAVADINSDGLPDILLCDQAQHHVEILSFNAQGELYSATKFKVFEQPTGVEQMDDSNQSKQLEPRAIVVGDVTGDGRNDLILLVHDRIIIYPQD